MNQYHKNNLSILFNIFGITALLPLYSIESLVHIVPVISGLTFYKLIWCIEFTGCRPIEFVNIVVNLVKLYKVSVVSSFSEDIVHSALIKCK